MSMSRKPVVGIVVASAVAALVISRLWAADPPAVAKVVNFAPVEDLSAQIDYYIDQIGQSLAQKDDYTSAKKSKVRKQASTLAALAMNVGLHDQSHPRKAHAAVLLQGARALATSAEDYDRASKSLAEIKASLTADPVGTVPIERKPAASLSALMKQVPVINSSIKRGAKDAKRFKRQSAEVAQQAATLGAIAQAAMFDTHEVKKAEDTPKWLQFSAEMRDAAGALNTAAHAADHARATLAIQRMSKSCDACHEVFRKEEH